MKKFILVLTLSFLAAFSTTEAMNHSKTYSKKSTALPITNLNVPPRVTYIKRQLEKPQQTVQFKTQQNNTQPAHITEKNIKKHLKEFNKMVDSADKYSLQEEALTKKQSIRDVKKITLIENDDFIQEINKENNACCNHPTSVQSMHYQATPIKPLTSKKNTPGNSAIQFIYAINSENFEKALTLLHKLPAYANALPIQMLTQGIELSNNSFLYSKDNFIACDLKNITKESYLKFALYALTQKQKSNITPYLSQFLANKTIQLNTFLHELIQPKETALQNELEKAMGELNLEQEESTSDNQEFRNAVEIAENTDYNLLNIIQEPYEYYNIIEPNEPIIDISTNPAYNQIFDKISNINFLNKPFFKRHLSNINAQIGSPLLAKTAVTNSRFFNTFFYNPNRLINAKTITRIFNVPNSQDPVIKMSGGLEVEVYSIAFYAGILKSNTAKKWDLILRDDSNFSRTAYEEVALFILETPVKTSILPQNFNENYFTTETIEKIKNKLTRTAKR